MAVVRRRGLRAWRGLVGAWLATGPAPRASAQGELAGVAVRHGCAAELGIHGEPHRDQDWRYREYESSPKSLWNTAAATI